MSLNFSANRQRQIPGIRNIARSKEYISKTATTSEDKQRMLRKSVVMYRSGLKFGFLRRLLWPIKKWAEDRNLEQLIRENQMDGLPDERENYLPRLLDDEQEKVNKAIALLEEVFEREQWNENTQRLIKQVEQL